MTLIQFLFKKSDAFKKLNAIKKSGAFKKIDDFNKPADLKKVRIYFSDKAICLLLATTKTSLPKRKSPAYIYLNTCTFLKNIRYR